MLRDREIATLRAALEATLDQTASVLRGSVADDGVGGLRTSYSAVGTVKVRLQVGDPSGGLAGPRRETAADAPRALLPCWADVRIGDLLEVGGIRYEVVDLVQAPFGIYDLARLRRL
jgi:hypothetical protein